MNRIQETRVVNLDELNELVFLHPELMGIGGFILPCLRDDGSALPTFEIADSAADRCREGWLQIAPIDPALRSATRAKDV